MLRPIFIHPIKFEPGKKPEFKNNEIYKKQTSVLEGWYNCGFWKYEKDRSLDQNAHYWACVVGDPMRQGTPSNFMGFTQDETHKFYKKKFNNNHSTTKLSTVGFANYVKMIQIYVAKNCNGLIIPDPNQIDFL